MKQRIAVLGAGPMGLAVAYELVQAGHQPIVFEADDRVGGMTACFDFNGLDIERFYHFHCTSDQAFLNLLTELTLNDRMHWVETKMGYWYNQQLQPWGNPWALLRFRGLSLIAKIRYGAHAFLSTKRRRWQGLDKQRACHWIKRWVGAEAYQVLWRPLFDYKFYHLANEISAAWIWSRVNRIGRSRYSVFREKLGYLEGGSTTLLQAMKAAIEAGGGEIHLQSAVTEVMIAEKMVIGLRINDDFHAFDKVISTIPLPYVPRIIPNLPADIVLKFQQLKNIAVVCVIVKLRCAVTENFWLNVNDPAMDIPGLVEYSNLRPLDQHVVYVPFYMPGDHAKFAEADQCFLDKVRHYLKTINPALCDEDFLDIRASRYRYAQPVCEPGHLSKLPPIALPIRGLWVADTSYYYPADRGISESIELGRQIAKQAIATHEEHHDVRSPSNLPQSIT